ncbi:MAG: hypothetical protein KIT10_13375 [Flavobacteriales bacterium]|nr:hypothetical protein [Flavobacteriales bacterium]
MDLKKRLLRSLRLLGIALAVAGVPVLLAFVERVNHARPVSEIDVRLTGDPGLHFVDEAVIRQAVLDRGTAVIGAPIGSVDLPSIEERLLALPAVATAEAYHTMDGTLHVKVRQRDPLVRVFNRDGESFYIDREGWTMPVSEAWTARVPVVTGHLEEVGARDGSYRVDEATTTDGHSRDIHRLALFIHARPLWKALIEQVVVDHEGVFELIPKVGGQRIVLGSPASWPDEDALAERFTKLELFYREGIPRSDWRRYQRVDLRFAGQIVCTQRTTP